jgi:hypothetical protein
MAEDSFIRPTLLFFGNTPDISDEKSLASSLQKIETCFMLIALSRYPSALSESVAAIESVLDSSGVPSLASKKG